MVIGADLMNRYKSSENRNQINILPMCLDDMITPDNEVRAIDAIVDRMDIQSMGFTYSGDWHKRVDTFINLFGEAPKELTDNIDKLDEIRKKRNSVGHDFARQHNTSGKIRLILDDEAQGISEEKLKKAWNTINDVAISIDTFLMKNFIGAYEFIAFYIQHWGGNVSKEAEKLKGSEKIKINNFIANQADACKRLLGEDGYHPISKEYSIDIIRYLFFEI